MSDKIWLKTMREAAQREGLAPKVDHFWFLRHGLTDSNKFDIIQGWLDTPLNAIGEQQVTEAAPILAAQPISRVISSPLTRARRSAEIVAAALGHDRVELHDDLRERGVGELEGQPHAGRYFWDLQSEQGETVEQFATRTVRGLNSLLTEGAPLIVAHGGIRRIIFAALDIPDTHMGNAIPLRLSRINGIWQVERLSQDTGRDTVNLLGGV